VIRQAAAHILKEIHIQVEGNRPMVKQPIYTYEVRMPTKLFACVIAPKICELTCVYSVYHQCIDDRIGPGAHH
jgi:hypothetical protein